MSGRIVVDYEELHRMSRVWAAASVEFARLAASVCELAASPSMAGAALLDPVGAARAETSILRSALGPSGLAGLAVLLAADAVRLDGVVARERLVDDLPVTQTAALAGFLVRAQWQLAEDPVSVLSPPGALALLREGRHRVAQVADATAGYLAPFTESLLVATAPSIQSRVDILGRRPVRVDPIVGLPIGVAGHWEREGPGAVTASDWQPEWAGSAPASLAEAMTRVSDLETQPVADLAVESITGADGVRRFVVELPGIRDVASRYQPEDLLGAVDAMAGGTTAYARCVREALDTLGVPAGAQVMLVGHSDGGIVAMELAADPEFNGSRVDVTHVIAAGSPISGKEVAPLRRGITRVLSVENVNDVVTHLDGLDSMAVTQSPYRLTYQYSDDEHGAGRNHAATGYAGHMHLLATSPNPLMREFQTSVQPYLWSAPGATSTAVFTLTDGTP